MRTALIAFALIAAPAIAQAPPAGKVPASAVESGTYKVDPNHTQVVWKVDHLGITPLYGAFGAPTGTLTLDTKQPAASKLDLTFPMSGMTVTSAGFLKHLSSPDFFDVAKYPDARFVSTSVQASGTKARVTGNLTMHGVTKPLTLDAEFFGARPGRTGKLNIGFTATGKIKRSDFGLGMGAPLVSDEADLKIVAAFERE